ncbi:unnamed protein product [Arabidopsis halleri]
MAYTNIMAVAVTTVLFLAVVIAPQWTEAKKPPRQTDTSDTDRTSGTDRTVCPFSVPEIVQNCYATMSALPSEKCCKDLKTASKTEVTCLCNNVIAHPNPLYTNTNQVNRACGVLDKYACDVGNANGGATKKIAASMCIFGLVASLFF